MNDVVDGVELVDHHCHGLVSVGATAAEFQMALTEAHHPPPAGTTYFDTPLGIALRRLCPPVLDLPAHADASDYLARRAELGAKEVAQRFLRGARLAALLVDTGFAGEETTPADLGELADCSAYTVHRIEVIAQRLLARRAEVDFVEALRAELELAAGNGVGFKSIIAYRGGLDFLAEPPELREVRAAVAGLPLSDSNLAEPIILRHVLYETLAVASPLKMAIQFHVGYGDTDLDLRATNPLHLRSFISEAEKREVPIVLLHGYPYHREAGYLAAAFPNVYFDIGLTVPHVGLGAERILAEALEVAPFSKLLYSSDATRLPELFFVASRLFRDAAASVFGGWVNSGMMGTADAERFVRMIGAENARVVYPKIRPA